MKVIHKHNIYLDKRQSNIYIDVMQADAYTRVLEFSLYSGGVAWNVPEGVDVAVAYIGSSGKGIYDTLPDGAAACAVNGNVVTAVVAPQAVAMDGNTNLSIIFTDDAGHQLAAFCVTLKVERNPAVNATKPPDYINLRQWLSKELADMVRGSTTVTITQKGDKLAADKIYAELHAAHVAGQTVHCKLPDGSVLALATADENDLLFQGENGRDYQQIIIGADGTITYKSGKYALLGELVTDATIGVYPSGDGYESTDTLEDLQESAKAGRTIVCNLQIDDRGHLRLPMSKKEDSAFYFSAVFEGKEYLVTINADGVTVEISECGGGNSGGNVDQGGGLSATAKALLISILRNGVYTTNQSASITALEAALAVSGGNGDSGDSGGNGESQTIKFTQTGSVLAIGGIDNITTITQTGSVLALA